MKLHFPNVLTIRLIEYPAQHPVPSIGLMITLFAPRKNNYHLVRASDGTGVLSVHRSEVYSSVKSDQDLFCMDYASSVEECEADVEIKVCSADEIMRAVNAMESFQFATNLSAEIIHGLKKTCNGDYIPIVQLVRLDKALDKFDVDIQLHRKHK